MAVGARDHIDRLLVGKYAEEKTLCLEESALAVEPEKMLNAMQDFAAVQRSFMTMQIKLKNICSNVTAKGASYRSSLPA